MALTVLYEIKNFSKIFLHFPIKDDLCLRVPFPYFLKKKIIFYAKKIDITVFQIFKRHKTCRKSIIII